MQHGAHGRADTRGAETLVGVDAPGRSLLRGTCRHESPRHVAGAEGDAGVEALGEEDDLLAAADRPEGLGELVEGGSDPTHAVDVLLALDPRRRDREVGEMRGHGGAGIAAQAFGRAADMGCAAIVRACSGQSQGIGSALGRAETQVVQSACYLPPVGGEARQHAHAAAQGERGDRDEVTGMASGVEPLSSRLAGPQDVLRPRKAEVEEQQDAPPRGEGQIPGGIGGDPVDIDPLEPRQRLRPAFDEDAEAVLVEVADRLTSRDHVHRHLDGDDVDRGAEGAPFCRHAGRGGRAGDHRGRQENESADPYATARAPLPAAGRWRRPVSGSVTRGAHGR